MLLYLLLVYFLLVYFLLVYFLYSWLTFSVPKINSQSAALLQMVSVERVIDYTHLPSEAELQNDTPLNSEWPKHGAITARNASFKYAENQEHVLKEITFDVKPEEKVDIKAFSQTKIFCSIFFIYIFDNNSIVIV